MKGAKNLTQILGKHKALDQLAKQTVRIIMNMCCRDMIVIHLKGLALMPMIKRETNVDLKNEVRMH